MILVTGASGQLGSSTLAALHARGMSAVGASRTPADDGSPSPADGGSRSPADGGSRNPAEVARRMDFDDPATLRFDDVSTLVLISAGYAEDDQVIARHAAVLEAARRDGVGHVLYTSVTGAGDHLGFALAHRATERLLEASGLAWTVLRNGLYAELFGSLLDWDGDEVVSAFGTGALAAVARQDLAEAAASVAAAPERHRGRTYELVGAPITAEAVAGRLGVRHRTVGLDTYRARLLAAEELLPFQPPMLASIATAVRHGFLDGTHPDLEVLLGRPATDPLDVAAAIAAGGRPVNSRARVAG